jgi:hypothetical protein
MSETTSQPENFFQKIEDEAVKIVDGIFGENGELKTIEQSIGKFSDAVVNEFKSLEGNPEVVSTADFFVKIAEGIDPALTPLISGIELAFPKILNIATNVSAEVDKPVVQQIQDAKTAINSQKAANVTLGSNTLGGIASAVSAFVFDNNATSLNAVTPSQLITAQQVIHSQAA